MIISYQWLIEYLPTTHAGMPEALPVNELSKILTSIGLEVEAVEPVESVRGGLEGLVIGAILTCEKHPNADKLSVTTVDIGAAEPLHIVCGAPNVAAGQMVVVATVGTTVYPTEGEPFLIKKAKIRGEESAGMICAEDEIGLGKSHAGIMILPGDAIVGMPAKEYFNIPKTDFAIHIGLTPNRSDANSHIGVARDVCAYLTHHKGEQFTVSMPETHFSEVAETMPVKVYIEAAVACPRYAGVSLQNVKVGPSPEWLQQRLATIGVRSINNIVDVTNYVLHEYGQPLHAFDADKIGGSEIHVRFMPEGSVFTGLDGKQRKLSKEDLVICDANNALALGGVFGGAETGITNNTTHVFIESAYFDPKHIRRTSLRHELRTDAATHFEKGVDINNVIPALKRAAAMIADIAGGRIASSITDHYIKPLQPTTITASYGYIQKLSGKEYTADTINMVLAASGFVITDTNKETLTVLVPSNKTDVLQPADLVEEILRIDGLDNIRIPTRLNITLTKGYESDRAQREHVAGLLCGAGMQETVTNSIVNSQYYPGRNDLVRMVNSLSSELDAMRPSMLEGGLEVIQYNCNRKNRDLSLFEFGNVYTRHADKYIQESKLGIWMTGNVRQANWNQQAHSADIFHLKGLLVNLLEYSGIDSHTFSVNDTVAGTEILCKWKNKLLCSLKQVPSARLNIFDIKQEVYFAEISWDLWVQASAANKTSYRGVPKFPSVQRDLAIILDTDVTYRQVEEVTEQLKLGALQSFSLFDVFESEKIGSGKKSYALSYIFQLHDRTLTDTETEQLMRQLAEVYKNKLKAQIRE